MKSFSEKPHLSWRLIFITLVAMCSFMLMGKAWATHETPPGLKFTCKAVPKGAILDVRDWEYPLVDENHQPKLKAGRQLTDSKGFSPNDGLRFKDALRDCIRKHKAIRRIDFTSGGGEVGAAFEIAQTIAEYGFHTHVPAGSRCISACTLAFLGGFRRTVDPQGTYEVHSFSSFGGEGSTEFSRKVLKILLEMGGKYKDPKEITNNELRVAVETLKPFSKSLESVMQNDIASILILQELTKYFRSQLTEIQRRSALVARNWMQTVQERRVSSRLLDHVFATTITGVRPLTREELKDLSVITDEAPATD